MNKSKKGFTLVELIVVLAILAVIAAIAVPTAFGSIEKARYAADEASIHSFNSAISMQAALISADPLKEGNGVAEAFKAAGLSAADDGAGKFKVQSSKGITVAWVEPTGSACGYFTVAKPAADATGNITKTLDLGKKLVEIATTAPADGTIIE